LEGRAILPALSRRSCLSLARGSRCLGLLVALDPLDPHGSDPLPHDLLDRVAELPVLDDLAALRDASDEMEDVARERVVVLFRQARADPLVQVVDADLRVRARAAVAQRHEEPLLA